MGEFLWIGFWTGCAYLTEPTAESTVAGFCFGCFTLFLIEIFSK